MLLSSITCGDVPIVFQSVTLIICQIYIDTSLILEVLEHRFPPSKGYGTLYPSPSSDNQLSSASFGSPYRPLIRGFASYWTDRPLFRVTTGLIPSSVWRTRFGADRANLIGHALDPEKLERKVPENLSVLDLQLSLLEPLFSRTIGSGAGGAPTSNSSSKEVESPRKPWVFDGSTPSAADIALYYQLDWGEKISRGEGIEDLTGGGVRDGTSAGEGMTSVFNATRYPGLTAWFQRFKKFIDDLPDRETRIERQDESGVQRVLDGIKALPTLEEGAPLIPTPAEPHAALDKRNGLVKGAQVSVAPDDTGRDSPTRGTLVAITPEEVVVVPENSGDGPAPAVGQVRVHFPRIGFVVRPVGGDARL